MAEFDGGGRSRRAIPLMGGALAAIVVAGVLYLDSGASHPPEIATQPIAAPALPPGFAASYFFLTPSLGWSVVSSDAPAAYGFVFRTTDGARHWTRIATGMFPRSGAELMFFDARHGVMTGYRGDAVALLTDDDGAHWRPVTGPGSPVAWSFDGWDSGRVLTATSSGLALYGTGDGGARYTRLSWPSTQFVAGAPGEQGLELRSGGEGWAGSEGSRPVAYSTGDGGLSWTEHVIPVPPHRLAPPAANVPRPEAAPDFVVTAELLPGEGVLVIIGNWIGDEAAVVSFDRGATWRAVASPPNGAFEDIGFLDSTHWWAFRAGFLYKTGDAGLTWSQTTVTSMPDSSNYASATVLDGRHAWSATTGDGASLVTTSDGGASWQAVAVPNPV